MANQSLPYIILERVQADEDRQNRIQLGRLFSPSELNTFVVVNRPGQPRVCVISKSGLFTGVDSLLAAHREEYVRYRLSDDLINDTFVRRSNK